ncbi:MAG: hypothetical protein C0483_24395 [Pirellula sp.]|nr:hypothetical protein [Pirellula sp.]
MRLLRAWESFWGYLGYLRRNRRQRKAAFAKRRSLHRRHRMDALEQRVVLNADPIAEDDEYLVGAGNSIQTGDYAPQLANDTDGDGDELSLRIDANPNRQITLSAGDTYSWNYLVGDRRGAFDDGEVRVTAEGEPSTMPFAYVENTGLRENGTTHSIKVRLSHSDPSRSIEVGWELQAGTAQEGSDYLGVYREAYTTEVWNEPYTTQEWIESGYYEQQWVPDMVDEPIWHEDQFDEFGQLVQAGYWEENLVDHGGYQDIYVSTGYWEFHDVEGSWSTEYHDAGHFTSGTIVFAPGEVEKTLNLTVVADSEFEGSESLRVLLTSADGANLVGWSDGTIILFDNAAPNVVTNAALSLIEGSSATIGHEQLQANDDFDDASSLIYTLVTAPSCGTLYLNGSALAGGSTFTQQYVNDGFLIYQDGMTGGGSLQFSVTDSEGAVSELTFSISTFPEEENDAPTIDVNDRLWLVEGTSDVITGTILQARDDHDGPSSVTYTIDQLMASGILYLNGSPLSAHSTFTQDNIDMGSVTFEAGASGNLEFTFTVTDAQGAETHGTFAITVLDATIPMQVNNGLTIGGGATRTITTGELQVRDEGLPADQLIYSVHTMPTHGTLYWNGAAMTTGFSLSQADIDDGLLSFQADTIDTDYFTFTVTDPFARYTALETFAIQIVNPEPYLIVSAGMSVKVGSTTTIDETLLHVGDDDSTAESVIYTLNMTPAQGTLCRDGSPLSEGSTFTQAEINTGRISYYAETPGGEQLEFTTTDESGHSTLGFSFAVTITNDNTPPEIAPGSNELIVEDHTFSLNAYDADGDDLTLLIEIAPLHGQLTMEPGNVVRYTPDADYNGTDSFRYAVSDGEDSSAYETVTVSIDSAEDAPRVPNEDHYSISEDGTLAIGLSDPDGDDLSIEIVSYPSHGDVSIDDNYINYTPWGDFNGSDTFVYSVSDGLHTVVQAIYVTIVPVDDLPTIPSDESYEIDQDSEWRFYPSDIDGDAFSLVITGSPSNGTAEVGPYGNGAYFRYVPTGSWTGEDSFSYQVIQEGIVVAEGAVNFTVLPTNQELTAGAPETYTIDEDSSLTVEAPGLLANDSSSYGQLVAELISGPGHAAFFTLNSDGSFEYAPEADWNGEDSFQYRVSDGQSVTDPITVAITVAAVNDTPIITALDGFYGVVEQTDLTLHGTGLSIDDLDAGDVDIQVTFGVAFGTLIVDPGTTGVVISSSSSQLVTLAGTVSQINALLAGQDAGTLIYRIDSDAPPAQDYLTISVNDLGNAGSGGEATAEAVVSIALGNTNDGPTATNDVIQVSPSVPLTFPPSELTANDGDPDGTTLNIIAFTQPAHGTLTRDTYGNFIYNVDPAYLGGDSFVYTISDGEIESSATVWLEVGSLVAAAGNLQQLSTNEDTSLDLRLTRDRIDGELATHFRLSVETGTLSRLGSPMLPETELLAEEAINGFTFTPGDNMSGTVTLTVEFGTKINGQFVASATGTRSYEIDVVGVNDGPGGGDDYASMTTDSRLHIDPADLLLNDYDLEDGTVSFDAISVDPAVGSLVPNGDGTYEFSPVGGFLGTVELHYAISDSEGSVGSGTLYVTVLPGNQDPVTGTAENYDVAINGVLTVDAPGLLANDYDPDGDELSASVYSMPQHASAFTLNSDGSFEYAPEAGWTGTDMFQYCVSDGTNTTEPIAVMLNVMPVNVAPTAISPASTLMAVEDIDLQLHGTGLWIDDADAGDASVRAGLHVSYGLLVVDAGATGVSVSGNGTTEVVFTGSIEDINELLAGGNGASIYYRTVSDAPPDTAQLTLSVNDLGNSGFGGSRTAEAMTLIQIGGVNDPPSSTDDEFELPEDGSLPVESANVLTNDSDDNASSVTAALYGAEPAHAAHFVLNSDGSFAYTPQADWFGVDSFQYRSYDGEYYSAPTTVTITVTPVNDSPLISMPATFSAVESLSLALQNAGISIADDSEDVSVEVTITAVIGELNVVVGTTGVIASPIDAHNVVLSGTIAQINGLLAGEGGSTIAYLVADAAGAESDTLTITVNDLGGYGAGGPQTTTITAEVEIGQEIEPPTISAAYAAVSESDAQVVVTLTLSRVLTEDVTITWATADRTAHAGADYVAATNTVTFVAGHTSAQITIALLNDSIDGDDKSFALELSGPDDVLMENSAVEIVISDDDASPTITIANTTADEAAGFAEFTVTLSAAGDRVVFVDWTTAAGTAGAADFVANNGRLAFAPGETSRKIAVELVNDDVHEDTKNFTVNLSNPVNATIPGSPTATATNANDDAPPTIRVISTGSPEGDGPATVFVELSRASESLITVDWSIVDGTAAAGDDYADDDEEYPLSGRLSFTPGTTKLPITVPITIDADAEPDETVSVELTSSDPLFATLNGTLTIRDDDRVRVKIENQEFDESAGVVGLVVSLQGAPDATVSVNWQIIDDTAVEGIDFELVKPHRDENNAIVPNEWDVLTPTDLRVLTFELGRPDPKIYVRILDNAVFDGDRQFRVQLSTPTNANVQTEKADITILDDESVPGHLRDIGVTAENYRAMFPPQVSAPPPPSQPTDTSLPAFPTTQLQFEIASRADAVRSVGEGVLKDANSWQRAHISVTAGTLGTASGNGRIEMAADGSFSFTPTLTGDLVENPIDVNDSFEYELVRSDGSKVIKTANLSLRPTLPSVSVSVPASIKEGSEVDITVSVGSPNGIAVISALADSGGIDDDGQPYASGFIDSVPWDDDVWHPVSYQPGATAHLKLSAVDDNDTNVLAPGPHVLPVYVTAQDSFWGTQATVRQDVLVENENPQLEITSILSSVDEGQPFLVIGKITDSSPTDSFLLTVEFQGGVLEFAFPNGLEIRDTLDWPRYAWNSANREFVLEIYVGDDSPEDPPTNFANELKFHLSDFDGGTCNVTRPLTVANTPPRIDIALSERHEDGTYNLTLNVDDWFDGCEVDGAVYDHEGNQVSAGSDLGLSYTVVDGWYGNITATDDDGGVTTRSFVVPSGMPDREPAPSYDSGFYDAMLAIFRVPDQPEEPIANPALRVYASDAFSGTDDGLRFVIESSGGSTTAPDFEDLAVGYSIRDKKTGDEKASGTSYVSYEGSQASINFNDWTGPSWRPKWDAEVELVITSVQRRISNPFGGSTLTATTIPTTGAGKTATAWIHATPIAASIDINLTQDPGRNPEAAAAVGEGSVQVGVREGDVRLAFDPSGMAFTPTYVGAEQLYPVALVKTTLPVAGAVSEIKAKLIIAGGVIDPNTDNSTFENSDIVGDEVTFEFSGSISATDLLHFAVPLVGKDLNSLRSGRHDFYVVFTVTDADGEHTLTQRGSFIWQNRFDAEVGETEFGDGWAIPELSRLIYSPANGAGTFQGNIAGKSGFALLNGDGTSEWFEVQKIGGFPLEPAAVDDSEWTSELIAESGGTISWTAYGQPGKLYELTVAWPPNPDLTSAATYEVVHGRPAFAGRNPQTTYTLNQQIGGSFSLGLFTPDDSGVIEIKLSADGKVAAGIALISEIVVTDVYKPELRADDHPSSPDSGLRLQLSDSDGLLRQFDFSGRLREIRDLNDNRIAFSYYGDQDADVDELEGLLKSVTQQGGLTTTYTYSGRYLDKIKDFADREVDYLIMGEELEEIKAASPGLGSQQPITKFDYNDGVLTEIERTISTGAGGLVQTTTIGRDGVFHRVTTVSISDTVTDASWSFTPIVAAAFYDDAHHLFAAADNHIGGDAVAGERQEVQATYIDTAGSTWIYQTDRLGYVTALAKPKVYAFDETTGTGFKYAPAHPEDDVVLQDEVWTWTRDAFGKAIIFVQPTVDENGVLHRQHTAYDYNGIRLSSIRYYEPDNGTAPHGLRAREDWVYEDITDEWGTVIARKLKEHKAFFDVQAGEPSSARLITKYVTDDRGNILRETAPDGSVTINQYTYKPHTINDLAGGLVDLTWDAVHGTTDYVYYGQSSPSLTAEERRRIGLLKEVTHHIVDANGRPDEVSESFTYDDNRNLDKATDIYGVETDHDYDELDRLAKTTHTHTEDAPSLVESTSYDGLGNIVREIRESGYVDPTSDLAPLIRTFQYETSYKYDVLERVKTIRDDERNADTEYAYENVAAGQKVLVKTSKPGELSGQVTTELYYDPRRQLTATVHPESTYFVYDPDKDIWRIYGLVPKSEVETDTTREKVVEFATYDQQGRIAASWSAVQTEVAPDDRKTTYTYDTLGRQWKVEGPDPDAELSSTLQNLPQSRPLTVYVYAADGSLKKTETGSADDPDYRTFDTSSYWGGRAEVDKIVYQGDGNVDQYYFQAFRLYDAAGRLVIESDANINFTYYAYDQLDRLISVRDAAGGVTEIDYFTRSDALDEPHDGVTIDVRAVRLERITAPPANDAESYPRVTWKQYDAGGNLIRVVNPDSDGERSTLKAMSDVYRYNADGTLAEQWQEEFGPNPAKQRQKWFEYDDAGRLKRVYDALGDLATYAYDRSDNIIRQGNGRGGELRTGYDELGRKYSEGQYDTATDALVAGTKAAQYNYDYQNNVTYTSDQFGDITVGVYDTLGRAVATYEPDVSFVMDTTNNVNKRDAKTTEYTFDDNGDLIKVKKPDGSTVNSSQFNELGQAKRVFEENVGSSSRTVRYEFDAAGNTRKFAEVVAGNDENVVEYEYDAMNRLHKERIFLDGQAKERVWTYDKAGNLKKYRDRDGRVTDYDYDALNRLTAEHSYGPGGVNERYGKNEFTYHQSGEMASAIGYTFAFAKYVPVSIYRYDDYDIRGRAQEVTETVTALGVSKFVRFKYEFQDAFAPGKRLQPTARSGYVVTASDNNGKVLYKNTYQMDAAGREVYAEQTSSRDDKQVLHDYFAGSNASMPDPVDAGVTPYAARRDLTTRSQKVNGQYQAVLKTATYYEEQDSGLVRRVDQLKADGSPLMSGTARLSHQYNYDIGDQLQVYIDRTGTKTIPHGPGGSATAAPYDRETTLRGGRIIDIQYDAEGHILSYTDDGIINDYVVHSWQANDRLAKYQFNNTEVLYYYDPFGRLIAHGENGVGVLHFYDGEQETLRFNSSGALQARFFYSAGELAAGDSDLTSSTYWTLTDAQASVRDAVAFSGAPSLVGYDYSETGALSISNGSFPSDFARYRGNTFVGSRIEYYNGRNWTSSLLDGQSLSAVSTTGPSRYPSIRSALAEPFNLGKEFAKQVVGRIDNGVQVGLGIFETGIGAAYIVGTGGIGGFFGGGFLVYNGLDNIHAGWNDTQTLTSQGAQWAARELGASKNTQEWVGFGADLTAGLLSGGIAAAASRSMAAAATRAATRAHVMANLEASAAARGSSRFGEHLRRLAVREQIETSVAANRAVLQSSNFRDFLIRSQASLAPASTRSIPGLPGQVTGGNSTTLGKNMMEEMGLPKSQKWTGYQAQHVIPSELSTHPVLQQIGIDLDHASNGMFLPTPDKAMSSLARHRGYHKVYNEVVRRQLSRMDVTKSVSVLEQEVFQLQQRLRFLAQQGTPMYPGKKMGGATVDLWERLLNQ